MAYSWLIVGPSGKVDMRRGLAAAVLPEAVAGSLARDVAMTGAIHVRELTRQDWTLLPS